MINRFFIFLFILLFSCNDLEKSPSGNEAFLGCTDFNASNYSVEANTDDGSCEYSGCMDPQSANYDSMATIDNGNCIDDYVIPEGFSYFWNDEFNSDSLLSRYWNMEIRWPGFVNNESQSYTDNEANIFIREGKLHIRALKDNPFDPNQPAYTSGRINTKGKVELQYGFWEIRAKLPSGVGTWPAIWMLNANIDSVGWPNCGEIDIMEHVGHQPEHVFFNIHNASRYGDLHGTSQQGVYEHEDIEDDFHTYSMEWDSTYIKAFVDGNLFYNYARPEGSNLSNWPYDNPFFLIINLAIGGEWGGQQGIDNSIFPATFIIDYVRIYEKQNL